MTTNRSSPCHRLLLHVLLRRIIEGQADWPTCANHPCAKQRRFANESSGESTHYDASRAPTSPLRNPNDLSICSICRMLAVCSPRISSSPLRRMESVWGNFTRIICPRWKRPRLRGVAGLQERPRRRQHSVDAVRQHLPLQVCRRQARNHSTNYWQR
jgi:hypothetical protein